jgi:hypothetical protein
MHNDNGEDEVEMEEEKVKIHKDYEDVEMGR